MAPNFRSCPECSTRNRLDKEFCVKCGESLEGVPAGDPAEAAKGKPGFLVSAGDSYRSPIVPVGLVLLTIGIGVLGWQNLNQAPPPATVAGPPPARPQVSLPPVIVIPMDPGVSDYTSGMAALRAGDFTSAVRFLRQAVAAAGSQAEYHLGLALALEAAGVTAESLAEFERATELNRGNARYVSEWAKALNRAGRIPEAIRAYESSLIVNPENLADMREVANLYLRSNDFARARPHLEKIVRLQPDDLTPKQSLGRVLEAARDLEGAAKQYRDILTAMPTAALTRAVLSDLLMRQNRPDEAVRVLDEGLSLDADAAILYREKGRIFDRQGKSAAAVGAYREYLKRAPGASDVRLFTTRIEQLSTIGE